MRTGHGDSTTIGGEAPQLADWIDRGHGICSTNVLHSDVTEPERIGIRELRQHASRYVAMARAGKRIAVTDRGD